MGRSFLTDFVSMGLTKGALIVLGLGTSIITARFLGPEGNGIIEGLIVYPTLFMSIGSLGIRQSTTYFLGKNIYSEDEIKAAIAQLWIITTLISVGICFCLMYYLSSSGKNISHTFLALLPLPFTLFNIYSSGIFLGRNDIRTFNKISWVPSLIIFIGTVFFVVFLNLEVSGALLAATGGPFFMSLILFVKNSFFKFFFYTVNWNIIKTLLSLGIVYAISLLVINLNYKLDVIFLDKLSSSYELGIYSKGSAVTQYLWQIPMLFSTIVFARSAISKDGRIFSLKVAQLLRLSIIFVGLGACVLFLFSKTIILSMYGEHFTGSVDVLNFLLPGVIILTIFKVMNMDLAGKGKPWVSMKAMLPALLINIILNFILIPEYGANGAAVSSTFSYSLAGILFLYFYSKETGISKRIILEYKKSDFEPIVSLIKRIKQNESSK